VLRVVGGEVAAEVFLLGGELGGAREDDAVPLAMGEVDESDRGDDEPRCEDCAAEADGWKRGEEDEGEGDVDDEKVEVAGRRDALRAAGVGERGDLKGGPREEGDEQEVGRLVAVAEESQNEEERGGEDEWQPEGRGPSEELKEGEEEFADGLGVERGVSGDDGAERPTEDEEGEGEDGAGKLLGGEAAGAEEFDRERAEERGGREKAGGEGEEGEGGAELSDQPADGETGRAERESEMAEGEKQEEVELDLERTEGVFPGEGKRVEQEEERRENKERRTGEPAPGEEEEADGERGVDGGVGDEGDEAAPLAIGGDEGERPELGGDEAVLVMWIQQVGGREAIFEPREERVVRFGVPLVQLRHVGAGGVDEREFAREDEEGERGEEKRAREVWF